MTHTSTRVASAYVLGHGDAELQRLAEQSAFYGDLTEDAFRRAGIVEGMRVLDAGCGAGDTSLLAAALVGAKGSVLGIDRSPEAIAVARRRAEAAGVSHVQFEISAIDSYSLPSSAPLFDAVVGRFILLYQSDPTDAVRRLASVVRPDGVMLFQEFDMRSARSSPVAPTYDWCIDRIITLYAVAGLEPDMGSKLYGTFQRAGLETSGMIGACRVEGGSDSFAYRYIAATMQSLLPMFERFGVTTSAEVQVDTLESRLRVEAVEGACSIVLPTLIAAWARTPS